LRLIRPTARSSSAI